MSQPVNAVNAFLECCDRLSVELLPAKASAPKTPPRRPGNLDSDDDWDAVEESPLQRHHFQSAEELEQEAQEAQLPLTEDNQLQEHPQPATPEAAPHVATGGDAPSETPQQQAPKRRAVKRRHLARPQARPAALPRTRPALPSDETRLPPRPRRLRPQKKQMRNF